MYNLAMGDLRQDIQKFTVDSFALLNSKYTNFSKYEEDYQKIISFGEQIVDYIYKTPGLCNDITLAILKEESNDFAAIQEEYRGLLNLIKIKHILFDQYKRILQGSVNAGNMQAAVEILDKMYNISKEPKLKLEKARLYWHKMNDLKNAYNTFKGIEPFFTNDIGFCWELSDLYKDLRDFYHETLYMQKAINLEIAKNPALGDQ